MRTRLRATTFAFFLVCIPIGIIHGQGMLLDSVLPRIGSELHNPALAQELRTLVPDFANQKVWGLAVGDFSNDSLPDLALSLYDPYAARDRVRVYFFENLKNQQLRDRFAKSITFIESPIEVGLSVEGSVVTITQKTAEQHWSQEGYSLESGDVTLVDRFETAQEDVTGTAKIKARAIGHEVYRNYETLRTRESYFTSSSGDPLLKVGYFTLPSYQRLRDIYPGYGHILNDTTGEFILSGSGFRRDASDLSIRNVQAAYNDDYLYLAFRIRDDYVVGGQSKLESNDRISLWFDSKYTGDRLNRDRRLLSKEGGFPTFRTALDSLVTNITFALPSRPGRVNQITYSTLAPLTPVQQEGLKNVLAQMTFDTDRGVVSGYTLSLRIPFTFLNFETNPARFYEKPIPVHGTEETGEELATLGGIGDAATLGFTALVSDVDDPAHPNEVTVQATSKYEAGNPSTFGTLVLEPSTLYYGEVHPTYLQELRSGLVSAGY
ncbi:MAG: hypothetical protein Q8922_02095 [Bacteroidota bacterium]|nr:hypothetical protein [Bacteroidota bacterium]MDP4232334.1 hypothetical protein [Bacteroidota bacterium]MDP4241473.1 hypothetical protein [Bacteroidota bacterium]MDP4286703.1 hypothetical protein [Bacteroidota bacterium]